MHPLEGHNTRSRQMWPLRLAVRVPEPVDEIYFFIKNIIKIGAVICFVKKYVELDIFLLENMFCQ